MRPRTVGGIAAVLVAVALSGCHKALTPVAKVQRPATYTNGRGLPKDDWWIPLVSALLGSGIGGLTTYWATWSLKKNERVAQTHTARVALCIALEADAGLCQQYADALDNTTHLGTESLILPQNHILTDRGLLLPVIQSSLQQSLDDLSDEDIKKLVGALRSLVATIPTAGYPLLTQRHCALFRGADKACRKALDALALKTKAFQMTND